MNNDVRERREAAGLSQADLGAAVDVTRQTINAIERERYDPSLELALKLAALFDCAIEDLFHPETDLPTPLDGDSENP
jgi:putative transcriptional regulator